MADDERRIMYQVGVEGDLFDRHPESRLCALLGCVPAEASLQPPTAIFKPDGSVTISPAEVDADPIFADRYRKLGQVAMNGSDADFDHLLMVDPAAAAVASRVRQRIMATMAASAAAEQ